MKTRLDRLIELSAATSELLEFKRVWDPATETWVEAPEASVAKTAAIAGAGGLTGAGAYFGHRAVTSAGGYGAVAANVRRGVTTAVSQAGPKLTSAGKKAGSSVAALLEKLRGIRLESREAKIIKLNTLLDGVIELDSPLADFNRAHGAIVQERRDTFKKVKKENKLAIRDARARISKSRNAIEEAVYGADPAVKPLQEKLHRESYVRRGAAIGGATGLVGGITAGILAGRKKGIAGATATLGGFAGGLYGAAAGLNVGGRIRRKHPLSA